LRFAWSQDAPKIVVVLRLSNTHKMKGNKPHSPSTKQFARNFILVAIGLLIGYFGSLRSKFQAKTGPFMFLRTPDVPFHKTSHVDANGDAILKKQLVEPFTIAPNIAGISLATLKPGQTVSYHSHASMAEMFYVISGSGILHAGEKEQTLAPGDFFSIPPPMRHEIQGGSSEDLVMMVVGVTYDAI